MSIRKKDTCIVTKQCGHVECQKIGRAMVMLGRVFMTKITAVPLHTEDAAIRGNNGPHSDICL